MTRLAQLLAEMKSNKAWDYVNPRLCGETEVARIAARLPNPMPRDLQTLFTKACGAVLGNLAIFSLSTLESVNTRTSHLFTRMPSAIFFGSDGGDGFFFVDTDGSLGCGREAVFWGDRGAMSPDRSVFCGDDLAGFLSTLIEGEEVWYGPSQQKRAVKKMMDALDADRDRWVGKVGADLKVLFTFKADRGGVAIPKVLGEFLRYTDGAGFPGSGVSIWGIEDIMPMDVRRTEGDLPFALLIGEDEAGNQYTITTGVSKNLPEGWPILEGRIVRLLPDQPLEQAEVLGYFPDVIVSWLEEAE
jgi:hypothetical protein